MGQWEARVREIRIAVSIVGGTSLAIYMNGVTQELFSLATAHIREKSDLYSLCLKLTGSQHARIDIISGTSAGGINGLFLATALANGKEMEFTEDTFCELADIDSLFHSPQKNPVSLFQGDKKLLEPLREVFEKFLGLKLDSPPDLSSKKDATLKMDMDLFVTGSYLRGFPKSILDKSNNPIHLRQHRAVFCFQQRGEVSPTPGAQISHDLCGKEGAGRDTLDAVAKRLATAARVTSSLPGVFEPALVEKKTFEDSKILDLSEDCWMGDGGYLNCRPLDLVVEAISKRKVGLESVSRKVLLIEPKPDPEQPKPERKPVQPSALKNIAQSLSVMISQSLESVLEDLADHNRQARLVNKLLGTIREKALAKSGTNWVEKVIRDDLTKQVYDNSCLEQVASELALLSVVDPSVGLEGLEEPLRSVLALERMALRAVDELYKVKELVLQFSGTTKELDALGKNLEKLYGKFKAARDLRAKFLEESASGRPDSDAFIKNVENLRRGILSLLERSIGELPKAFKEAKGDLLDPLHEGLVWLAGPSNLGKIAEVLSNYFIVMDVLLFPLEYSAGLVTRDEIDFHLVDPGVVLGLSVLSPDKKLCGDAYSKFGGFFREPWRRNDILWGRLDGSARLVEILLGDPNEWAPKDQAPKLIRAYLGLGEDRQALDRYGQYLMDVENAEKILAQWETSANGEQKDKTQREVLNLIVLRHHLELLERKLPQLLRAELEEAKKWRVEPLAREVLNVYFPRQDVEEALASLPAQPLETFLGIHKRLNFGSQDLGDIPSSISFARLTTAIRVATRAIAHSLPPELKGNLTTLMMRATDKVVPLLLPIAWGIEKLRRRFFGKKSENYTKSSA